VLAHQCGGFRNNDRPLGERLIPPAFETSRGDLDCGFELRVGQFLERLECHAIVWIYALVGFALRFGCGFAGYFLWSRRRGSESYSHISTIRRTTEWHYGVNTPFRLPISPFKITETPVDSLKE